MSLPDPYAAHERFVSPARTDPSVLRVIGALVLIEVAFAMTPALLGGISEDRDGSTTWGLVVLLTGYGLPVLALILYLRGFHGRAGITLIGDPALAIAQFRTVVVPLTLALLAIEFLPPWPDFSAVVETRDLARWLIMLPVALVAILIQSGSEEVIFRGYLQQELAAQSQSRWVWMGIPSLLFGLLHYGNGAGPAEGLLWAAWAAGLGFACADLTARAGTIGPAIALHFVNNAFVFLLYGMQGGPDSGFALWLFPFEDSGAFDQSLDQLLTPWAVWDVTVSAAFLWIMWLAARIGLGR